MHFDLEHSETDFQNLQYRMIKWTQRENICCVAGSRVLKYIDIYIYIRFTDSYVPNRNLHLWMPHATPPAFPAGIATPHTLAPLPPPITDFPAASSSSTNRTEQCTTHTHTNTHIFRQQRRGNSNCEVKEYEEKSGGGGGRRWKGGYEECEVETEMWFYSRSIELNEYGRTN